MADQGVNQVSGQQTPMGQSGDNVGIQGQASLQPVNKRKWIWWVVGIVVLVGVLVGAYFLFF